METDHSLSASAGAHRTQPTLPQTCTTGWLPVMISKAFFHSDVALVMEASMEPPLYWLPTLPVAESMTDAYHTVMPPRFWSLAAFARDSMVPAPDWPPAPSMTYWDGTSTLMGKPSHFVDPCT